MSLPLLVVEGPAGGRWCHVPSWPGPKHAGRNVKTGGDLSDREKSPVTATDMCVVVFLRTRENLLPKGFRVEAARAAGYYQHGWDCPP